MRNGVARRSTFTVPQSTFTIQDSSLPVRDPPDLSRAVITDQQRSVLQNQHIHRPAPHFAARIAEHPAGEKVVVAAGRAPALHRDAYDLVTRAMGAVP